MEGVVLGAHEYAQQGGSCEYQYGDEVLLVDEEGLQHVQEVEQGLCHPEGAEIAPELPYPPAQHAQSASRLIRGRLLRTLIVGGLGQGDVRAGDQPQPHEQHRPGELSQAQDEDHVAPDQVSHVVVGCLLTLVVVHLHADCEHQADQQR